MVIGGVVKTSFSDYPNCISTVLFLQGCNLKCGYCHNKELVVEDDYITYNMESVFKFLKKRDKLIDGVVITGGEPLINNEIVSLLDRIKKDTDLKIKIDTNGAFPERLQEIIDNGLVDYIAMDLKLSEENNSPELIHPKSNVTDKYFRKVKQSIDVIMNSDIDYEFRSTLIPDYHDILEIQRLGKMIKGSKEWNLQNFKTCDKLIDPSLMRLGIFTQGEMEEFKEEANKFVENVKIR